MNKSAADAEREVERSRGDLDRTVEALKEKMTPGQLLDEATRSMGVAGNQVVSKLLEQAKENPMPLAVMGLGLAWLMTTTNKGAHAYRVPSSTVETGHAGGGLFDKVKDTAGGASDALHGVSHAAGGAASKVGEQISGAASGAVHSAQALTGKVGDMAGAATHGAGALAQSGRRTVMDLMDKEPLLLGGAGLLAGLALGAALPATDQERRYIGPLHDRVLDKSKDVVQGGLGQLSEAAQAAYQGVKTELQHKPEGEQPADTAARLAHAGMQAAQDSSTTAA